MYGDVLCCGFDFSASDEIIKNERKFSENLKNIFRKYVLHFDKKYFMLFSISGFSPEMKRLVQDPQERLCLVEASELVPIHKESNDE